MEDKIVYAPWTEKQVDALQAWQEDDTKHAYTCICGESLTPYLEGWQCDYCGHKQNWCHGFSLEDALQAELDKAYEIIRNWRNVAIEHIPFEKQADALQVEMNKWKTDYHELLGSHIDLEEEIVATEKELSTLRASINAAVEKIDKSFIFWKDDKGLDYESVCREESYEESLNILRSHGLIPEKKESNE